MPDKPLQPETVVARNPAPVSADLGAGETALMHVDRGYYYGLNPVAARIWALLESPRTVAELERLLLAEYDVARQRCRSELLDCLQSLLDEGLVTLDDAPAD